ncbi:MAG: hypothetical protein AAF752_03005 [Bacteroidota bacterium]
MQLLGDTVRTAEAGGTLTMLFRVAQSGQGQTDVAAAIDVPAGWLVVTPVDTLSLVGTTPTTQLVSVRVPAQEMPATYTVAFRVRAGGEQANAETTVNVQPRFAVQALVQEVPSFVQAGDDFDVTVQVQNESNTEANINLRTNVGRPIPAMLSLGIGEAALVRIQAEAPNRSRGRTTLTVVLTAEVEDQDVRTETEVSVSVLGRRMEDRRARRDPAFLSASLIGPSLQSLSPQLEFYGEGQLDDAGEHRYGFEFRVPDVDQRSLYDRWDRYWAYYERPELRVSAGDGSYGLTPLTDPTQNGFGLDVETRRQGWIVGGFARRSRRSTVRERAGGARVGYAVSDERGTYGEVSAQLGARTGFDEAQTFSLRSQIGKGRRIRVDAEVAGGIGGFGGSQAYRVELQGQEPRFTYYAAYTSVERTYPGYQRGTGLIRGDATYRPAEWFQAELSASRSELLPLEDRTGRAQDQVRASVQAVTRIRRFEMYGRFGGETRGLAVNGLARRETGIVGEIQAGVRWLNVNGWIGTGEATGLEGEDRYVRYRLGARSALGPLSLGGGYQDRTGPTVFLAGREQLSVTSLFASLNLRGWTRLSFNLTSSQDRSVTDARYTYATGSLNQRVWQGHILNFDGTWIDANAFGGDAMAFRFSYRVPFGLPTLLSTNQRTIRGYFYDTQTRRPLPDVLVYFGDEARATDARGRFEFSVADEGPHYITVDQRSIGFSRITSLPMPIEVQFAPDQEVVDLDIAVSEAATIEGRVVLYQHESTADQLRGADPVPVGGLRALVEINNADFVQRQYSDPDGRFAFAELPPGTYTLVIRTHRAPPNHAYTDPPTIITVSPGETSSTELRILPTTRQIRMLDSG